MAQGRLHPEIGTLLPWDHTGEVVRALRQREVRGNAVLTVAEGARRPGSGSARRDARTPLAVLQHYVDVLEDGDLDAVADCFSEDATWWVHGTSPLSGTKRGRAEIARFLSSASSIFTPGSQRFRRHQTTAEAERVVLEWQVTGTSAATGLAYDNSYCGVFVVRSGRIVEVREYLDSLHATHVLFGSSRPT